MKKLALLIVCSLFVTLSFSQSLVDHRDSAFQNYRSHKDTITVRTWMNMVELANKLETLMAVDNMLIDSLLIGTPTNADLENRVGELENIRTQLINDNARLNQANADLEKQYKLFYTLFIVSTALLLIIFGFFIYQFNKLKSLKDNTDSHSEDVLKMKHVYNQEVSKLQQDLLNLQAEKEMLENNAVQMKKSFETVKEEKQSLKAKLLEMKDQDNLGDIRKEVEEMSEEVSRIMQENQDLQEELDSTKQALIEQKEVNKSIESDLANLFNRFKKD